MVKKPEDDIEKKVTNKKTASKKKSVAKKKVSKKKAVVKKNTPKRTVTSSTTTVSPRERYEMIATMAYYRAEARNFEPGYDVDDWLDCEKFIDNVLK